MQNYKLIFCESATGIILDQYGERHLATRPLPEVFFENERDAELAAQDFMSKFPFAECVLTNLSDGNETRMPNPDADLYILRTKWRNEKSAYENWISRPWLFRVLTRCPVLHIFDPDNPNEMQTNA